MLQGLIKFTLKLTGRHLGLSFQKNLSFWLFDRGRNVEKRYNVGPLKQKYIFKMKNGPLRITHYIYKRSFASEK